MRRKGNLRQKIMVGFLSAMLVIGMAAGTVPTEVFAAESFSGSGIETDPYLIQDVDDLQALAVNVNNGTNYSGVYFKLSTDLDLSGIPWTPIGTERNSFAGTFDGGENKIIGLSINAPNSDYQGLFGYLNGGTIKNLGVDGTVTGKSYVGGVAGFINYSSIVENCYNTSTVTGYYEVGGVTGCVANQSVVRSCYNSGTLTGTGDGNSEVGGIAGSVAATVENCYNTGKVTGTSKVGGVAGDIFGGAVSDCYNTGTVNGNSGVGGMAGNINGGTVLDCYNTGKVTGNSEVGGIAGILFGTVGNCYNTGTVTGNSKFGGVVGSIATYGDYTGIVSSCYYLLGTAQAGIGEGSGNAESKTEETFKDQTTFAGWKFDGTGAVWEMSQHLDRPILRSNPENTHRLTHVLAKSATCTEDGNKEYYTCSGCDTWFTDSAGNNEIADKKSVVIPAGHTYDTAVWKSDGTNHWHECTVCGAKKDEVAHSYGDWTVTKEATENAEGSKERSCTVCGYKQTEVIPIKTQETTQEPTSEGKIETTKEQGENTPNADFGSTKDDLIGAVLTQEDKDLVDAGTDIKIILDIDNIDASVNQSDKQVVTAKADGYSVGQYLDINLYKIIDENREKISQTTGNIKIVIAVPDTVKNTDSGKTRSYAVVRVHDGVADLLTDLDNDEATITIETDRFSTYAIVYKDTASTVSDTKNDNPTAATDKNLSPTTGDDTPIKMCVVLVMIAGISCLTLFCVNRKKNMRV